MRTFVQDSNNNVVALQLREDHDKGEGPIFTFVRDDRRDDPWALGATGTHSFMKKLTQGHILIPGSISVPFSNCLEIADATTPLEAAENITKSAATPEQVIEAFELIIPTRDTIAVAV